MASLAMTRLINNLRARLPGATDNLINYELYNVLNDWFQDTNMWYEDIEFPVFANTADSTEPPDNMEYVLATNQTAAIVRLMGVVDEHDTPVGAYMPEPGP